MDEITLAQFRILKSRIAYLKTVLASAINDLQEMKAGLSHYYSLDFGDLYPYLFSTTPENTRPNRVQTRELAATVLELNNLKATQFQLVFSGISFIELADQFEHRLRGLEMFANELSDLKRNYSQFRWRDDTGIKLLGQTTQFKEALAKASHQGGYDFEINSCIQRMEGLLSRKKLIPLGELVQMTDIDPAKLKIEVNELSSNIMKLHTKFRREKTRKIEDERFHATIDALHVRLFKHFNTKLPRQRVYYTTQDSLHYVLGFREGNTDTRSTLVPLSILNSYKLLKDDIYDQLDYFEEVYAHAEQLEENFGKVPKGEIPKRALLEKALYFKEMFLNKLYKLESADFHEKTVSREELLELLVDETVFKETIEETRKKIVKKMTDFIEEHSSLYPDLELCAQIMEDDPILKKIGKYMRSKKRRYV